MLHIKKLRKSFGDTILRYPDLTVEPGETLWLRGDSGSGKTTLLHLMAGLLKPDAGSISLHDHLLTDLRAAAYDRFRARHIGMIFQQAYLHPALTVKENLALARGLQASDISLREELGIAEFQHQKPAQISGGQAQRAAVMRGLLNLGELLLADEPTASLDPQNFERVMKALQTAATKGKIIILASHDPRTAPYADREVVLEPLPS